MAHSQWTEIIWLISHTCILYRLLLYDGPLLELVYTKKSFLITVRGRSFSLHSALKNCHERIARFYSHSIKLSSPFESLPNYSVRQFTTHCSKISYLIFKEGVDSTLKFRFLISLCQLVQIRLNKMRSKVNYVCVIQIGLLEFLSSMNRQHMIYTDRYISNI